MEKKTKKLEVSMDAIANFNADTSALDVTNCLVWRTFYNVRVDRVRVNRLGLMVLTLGPMTHFTLICLACPATNPKTLNPCCPTPDQTSQEEKERHFQLFAIIIFGQIDRDLQGSRSQSFATSIALL
jgi:hypothetical protein